MDEVPTEVLGKESSSNIRSKYYVGSKYMWSTLAWGTMAALWFHKTAIRC